MKGSLERKRGSQFAEAAMILPLIVLSLGILLSLVRLDRLQENEFFLLANKTEKAMLPASTSYTAEIAIPLFRKELRFQEMLYAHPFSGEKFDATGIGTEALEREEGIVWVFPRRGEKYHIESCRIVTVYPFERILTPALKKQYSPCSLCNPETVEIGTPVYVFKTGDVYHTASCPNVTRYVIPMAKTQAEEKGYEPCSYCNMN